MRFKYLGELNRNWVFTQGPCLTIKVPKKDGSVLVINASDQTNGFTIGDDIGVDITDERSLRVMRSDPRFQEI